MTRSATAKAEKAKKGSRGSSSSAGASTGFVQGEWMPPRATADRLKEMESQGLLVAGSWRLPAAGVLLTAPRGDERVLLTTHIDRGMVSLIPVVNRAPADVASDNERQEDTDVKDDYVEDSEGSGEDKEDESDPSDEAEYSPSKEILPETRARTRQAPGGHGGNAKGPGAAKSSAITLPIRSSKRGRGEPTPSPEKSAKQPKVTATKPWKAVLPKTKMHVPVDSA